MFEFFKREPEISKKQAITQMRASLNETLGQKIRDLHTQHLAEIRATIAEINQAKAGKAPMDSLYRGASTWELEETLKYLHEQIQEANGRHLKFWAETRARRQKENNSADY